MTFKLQQASFAAGEVTPELVSRTDLLKFQTGARELKNFLVMPHGGVVNRQGTKFVSEVEDSILDVRFLHFIFNQSQTYVLVFGDMSMHVVKNGRLVLKAAQTIDSVTQANPGVITVTAHGLSDGDHVSFSNMVGMDELQLDILVVRNATANTFEVGYIGSATSLDTTGYAAFTSGEVSKVFRINTIYPASAVPNLKFVQSADVLFIVHPEYAVRKLSRTADDAWNLQTVTFVPGISAPTGVSATNTTGSGSTTYTYKVTAVSEETGEESLPSSSASTTNDLTIDGNKNTVSWSSVAGAERYEIYKDDNGIFGFIGGTEGLSFEDQNIIADLSLTPPKEVNPFNGTGNYPSVVTFFEQRLVLAATLNKPQTLWFSTTANFENFGSRTPAQDDDAVTVTLVARQVNAIRDLVAQEDLWALTGGGEWRMRGGGDVDFITPSSVTTRKISSWGASDVAPLEIGSSVIFVVDKGQGVRDLFNRINFTEFDVQEGSDLSILAPHLFRGRSVVSWAYAQVPYSVVWVVMSDGALLSFTYYREHQVYAWAQHANGLSLTEGNFEDVVVVPETGADGTREDVPYFLVRRQVNGRVVRYIECMPKRVESDDPADHYFVDCGATYSGAAVTTISGLRHLEARTVTALADGNVVADLVVTDGKVTLPFAAKKVHVGLPYTARLRSLPLEIDLQDGSTTSRRKNLPKIVAKIRNSRGMQGGAEPDRLEELKEREREAWGDPTALTTGTVEVEVQGDWKPEAEMWLVQPHPLPLEVLSITPEYDLGR